MYVQVSTDKRRCLTGNVRFFVKNKFDDVKYPHHETFQYPTKKADISPVFRFLVVSVTRSADWSSLQRILQENERPFTRPDRTQACVLSSVFQGLAVLTPRNHAQSRNRGNTNFECNPIMRVMCICLTSGADNRTISELVSQGFSHCER